MSYTVPVWFEWDATLGRGMTEAEKIDGLNAIEGQYTAFVTDYLHDHNDVMYTIAECNAKYKSGTSATGDWDMLDGYQASEILAAGIAPGCIGIWSGSIESIPGGWYHCDGSNGTPYLLGRFLVGAGAGGYSPGDIGGYDSITPTVANITIAATALASNMIPDHTHGYADYTPNTYNGTSPAQYGLNFHTATSHASATDYTGSGQAHGHPGSTASIPAIDNRPPYKAYPFIMKAPA